MDFIRIDDHIVDDDSQQVEDIGFIENNKLYNSRFHDTQNKRVYPTPQKILPGNPSGFVDDNKKVSKRVTYDDILSSLNMKVINGKLQIVRGDVDVSSSQQKTGLSMNQQQTYKPYNRNTVPTKNMTTTNYLGKNGKAYTKQDEFYNKFLQAQAQAQAQVHAEDALTPEEKKRLLMIQYIKYQQERQHISRVKSRKLNFV